jgi:hypothetical protein
VKLQPPRPSLYTIYGERNIWQVTIEVGMSQRAHNGDTFLVRNQNYREQPNASSVTIQREIVKRNMAERLNETNEAKNLLEHNNIIIVQRKKSYSPNMEKKSSIQHPLAVPIHADYRNKTKI